MDLEPVMEKITERLIFLVENSNFTKRQLAESVNISRQRLYSILNKRKNTYPKVFTCCKLSISLKVPPEIFFNLSMPENDLLGHPINRSIEQYQIDLIENVRLIRKIKSQDLEFNLTYEKMCEELNYFYREQPYNILVPDIKRLVRLFSGKYEMRLDTLVSISLIFQEPLEVFFERRK
ncbi:helix-turn-helix domain-containing protein [Virgibacillus halodenitrificans]|uniref:helix-turn-helix domain-containing protein n=1 Tax=Virgibacillus halodenitrificans TaxID=1482 RepID=UPI001F1DEB26|nr:helix-turn-helix transcriptional regulator [Virgibacillus halodenitrificans]